MNLTELQIQLRSIEEHISFLQVEIEKMKPQPEDETKAMFEQITEMAKKVPLENRSIHRTLSWNVDAYISCLAYISLVDDSKIYEKLLFLCRLCHSIGVPTTAEDIFRMGLEVDEKYFEKSCLELKKQKYSLLTDALILVNITEEATTASLAVVADIAKIFECDKDDLRAVAMVAKAVLIEDFSVLNQIPMPSKNCWMGQFKEHIPMAWVNSQRIKCGRICTERKSIQTPYLHLRADNTCDTTITCVVKKRINAGSIVHKGDLLLEYEEPTRKLKPEIERYSSAFASLRFSSSLNESYYETILEKKSIVAPCDGVVFFIESIDNRNSIGQSEKYLEAYVVSYFDDYADFCDWHKGKTTEE